MKIKFLKAAIVDAVAYAPGQVADFDTKRAQMFIYEHTGELADPFHAEVRRVLASLQTSDFPAHDCHDRLAAILAKVQT